LGIYLDSSEHGGLKEEAQLVGWLSQEGGEFVFKYDPRYAATNDAEPIPAFPDLDEVYRSRDLWPFFAIRIPPLDREDVKELLDRESIGVEEGALRLLATLAGRSVANRYELRLSGA
jgi:hypothetical protein